MSDIKKEIDKIDDEISALRRKRSELEKIEKAEYLETAKENVGRCFYDSKNKNYCKIIDVPQDEWTPDCRCIFTKDYYPVIVVSDEERIPVQEDAFFLKNDGLENFDTEISKEKFSEVFTRKINEFINKIV